MRRGVIYRRLSKRQKGERNAPTLDVQESDCRKLAKDLGDVVIVAVLSDYGQSAFDRDDPDDRPGYAELCEMVRRRDVDVVLAWHTDRLWRDDLEKALFIRDAQRFKLDLVVTKTAKIGPANPDDEFLLSILTAVAKKESADKRRRIRSKLEANAAEGKAHGGAYRPFGFDDDRVTIRDDEAEIVREMARRLLSGETLHAVARWLESTGAGPSGGGAWTTQRVRTIAVNPRYSGRRAVGRGVDARVVAKALWKPIISGADSDKLRALLLDPNRRVNRSARTYLLSGLVRCDHCGSTMRSRIRSESGRRTYVCSAGPGLDACGRMRIVAEPLEEHVADALALHVADPAVRKALRAGSRIDPEVSSEIGSIDAKSAKLAAAWANGELDDAGWAAARATLTERRARLAAQVRRVSTLPATIAEYVDDPAKLTEDWSDLTFDQQRAIVVALVNAVVIGPGDASGPRRFDADRVLDVHWQQPA